MAIKTQAEIDTMMALPSSERPRGWAWWTTAEMQQAAIAREKAEAAATEVHKAARAARIAAENAEHGQPMHRGAGWCNKCQSHCYGDCRA